MTDDTTTDAPSTAPERARRRAELMDRYLDRFDIGQKAARRAANATLEREGLEAIIEALADDMNAPPEAVAQQLIEAGLLDADELGAPEGPVPDPDPSGQKTADEFDVDFDVDRAVRRKLLELEYEAKRDQKGNPTDRVDDPKNVVEDTKGVRKRRRGLTPSADRNAREQIEEHTGEYPEPETDESDEGGVDPAIAEVADGEGW